MDGGKAIYGFELDHEALCYQEVESRVTDGKALVVQRDGDLSSEGDAAKGQLDSQGLLIDRFEKARPEDTMDFHGGIDDGMGGGVQVGIGLWELFFEVTEGVMSRVSATRASELRASVTVADGCDRSGSG